MITSDCAYATGAIEMRYLVSLAGAVLNRRVCCDGARWCVDVVSVSTSGLIGDSINAPRAVVRDCLHCTLGIAGASNTARIVIVRDC